MDGAATSEPIPLLRGSFLAKHPDLLLILRLAATGRVRDPDALVLAFTYAFVDAEVARASYGRGELSRELHALQRDALAPLPEFRAPHVDVDAAAIEIAAEQRDRLRTDPLYELTEPLRSRLRLRVPRNGFPYQCEVCRTTGLCASAKGAIVRPIDWGSILSASGRFPLIDGGAAVFRLVLCCVPCRRRAVRRCEHEQLDAFEQRWERCHALSLGSAYCARHRSRAAERGRRLDTAQRRVPLTPRDADYGPRANGEQRRPWLVPCLPRPGGRC
jgi:hypothetical protein